MSLNDDDCKKELGEPRQTLLSRYLSATKVALSRAKFMSTTSLVVLQALVLYVMVVRDIYEPRVVWSLTGVAVRIAQSMGLERDGVSLGLPPFETEMRRRIWWLLKTHDFKTAELCGLAKFRDLDMGPGSTKWPTNVNDDQLYPNMPSLPSESNTMTDMAFIAVRGELIRAASRRVGKFREQEKNFSQWDTHSSETDNEEMNKSFKDLEDTLETKYLRYCDPSQSLNFMVMLMARTSMNFILFQMHHPRRWVGKSHVSLSERQLVWDISLKLLEQHSMISLNPHLKQYSWCATYFLPWHPFVHTLDTLRADPLTSNADKAWQLVSGTFSNTLNKISERRKLMRIAIGNLCLKAYSAREAAMQDGIISHTPTPDFILQTRQWCEDAKSKMQAKVARKAQLELSEHQNQADPHAIDIVEHAYPHRSTKAQPPSAVGTGGTTEEDSFWTTNGFDDGQLGNLDDSMNIDFDLMLAQDQNLGEPTAPIIPWEQWDLWLADSTG
jgi:Fungal specific transcription factor domain